MSELSKILGAYGAGHVLSHGGKDYTFGAIDQHAKDALTNRYFKRARESVYAMKGEVTDEEYQVRLREVGDRFTQGGYDFPESECFGFYVGAGLPELVQVMTGCDAADAFALVRDRGLDVMHIVLCVVGDSFPDFKKKMVLGESAGLFGRKIEPLLRLLGASPPQNSPSPAAGRIVSPA